MLFTLNHIIVVIVFAVDIVIKLLIVVVVVDKQLTQESYPSNAPCNWPLKSRDNIS